MKKNVVSNIIFILIGILVGIILYGIVNYSFIETKKDNPKVSEAYNVTGEEVNNETPQQGKSTELANNEPMSITKDTMVGTWHLTFGVGAGYNDLYHFNTDGTFTLEYNQYNEEKRLLDISGDWEIIYEHYLMLTIKKKHVKQGGTYEPSSPSALSEYAIEGGTIVEESPEPYETIIYPLENYKKDEENLHGLSVEIGGRRFWKLGGGLANESSDEEEAFYIEHFAIFQRLVALAEEAPNYDNIAAAYIQGVILKNTIGLDDKTISWINTKREWLEEERGDFSIIYTGISSSKIQYIALLQPTNNRHLDYKDAINNIRGKANEMTLLSTIGNLEKPNNYYVIDLHTTDLTGNGRSTSIDNMHMTVDNKQIPYIPDWDNQVVHDYLNTLGRNEIYNNTIKDQSWQLMFFPQQYATPESITITADSENIILK